MDKETVMKTTKFTAALAMAWALTACHGQNPFKRESNPIKDYPATSEVATEAYIPGQTPATPPAAPRADAGTKPEVPPTPCVQVLTVKTEPAQLNFKEGVESTYAITVTSGGFNLNIDIQAEKPQN